MAEILPDGTMQGYFNICPDCKETIQVNMQGAPINHKCEVKNLDIPHVVLRSEQLPDDLDHDSILDGDDPHALGLRP